MQTSIARSPFPSFATYHLTCDSAQDPAGQVGFARPVRPDSAHACKSSLSSRHGAPITPEWFECHTRPRAGASQTNAAANDTWPGEEWPQPGPHSSQRAEARTREDDAAAVRPVA